MGPAGDRREIVAPARDHVPDTAGWVGHVAGVARDDVDVEVGDGLAGGLADVDADGVAVWFVVGLDSSAGLIDERQYLSAFRGRSRQTSLGRGGGGRSGHGRR